jgi:hypothetical protein
LGLCIAHNYHESGRMSAPCSFCAEADSLGLFPDNRRRIVYNQCVMKQG